MDMPKPTETSIWQQSSTAVTTMAVTGKRKRVTTPLGSVKRRLTLGADRRLITSQTPLELAAEAQTNEGNLRKLLRAIRDAEQVSERVVSIVLRRLALYWKLFPALTWEAAQRLMDRDGCRMSLQIVAAAVASAETLLLASSVARLAPQPTPLVQAGLGYRALSHAWNGGLYVGNKSLYTKLSGGKQGEVCVLSPKVVPEFPANCGKVVIKSLPLSGQEGETMFHKLEAAYAEVSSLPIRYALVGMNAAIGCNTFVVPWISRKKKWLRLAMNHTGTDTTHPRGRRMIANAARHQPAAVARLSIVFQLLIALNTIHEAGLLHRDAHQGNTMLQPWNSAVMGNQLAFVETPTPGRRSRSPTPPTDTTVDAENVDMGDTAPRMMMPGVKGVRDSASGIVVTRGWLLPRPVFHATLIDWGLSCPKGTDPMILLRSLEIEPASVDFCAEWNAEEREAQSYVFRRGDSSLDWVRHALEAWEFMEQCLIPEGSKLRALVEYANLHEELVDMLSVLVPRARSVGGLVTMYAIRAPTAKKPLKHTNSADGSLLHLRNWYRLSVGRLCLPWLNGQASDNWMRYGLRDIFSRKLMRSVFVGLSTEHTDLLPSWRKMRHQRSVFRRDADIYTVILPPLDHDVSRDMLCRDMMYKVAQTKRYLKKLVRQAEEDEEPFA